MIVMSLITADGHSLFFVVPAPVAQSPTIDHAAAGISYSLLGATAVIFAVSEPLAVFQGYNMVPTAVSQILGTNCFICWQTEVVMKFQWGSDDSGYPSDFRALLSGRRCHHFI